MALSLPVPVLWVAGAGLGVAGTAVALAGWDGAAGAAGAAGVAAAGRAGVSGAAELEAVAVFGCSLSLVNHVYLR